MSSIAPSAGPSIAWVDASRPPDRLPSFQGDEELPPRLTPEQFHAALHQAAATPLSGWIDHFSQRHLSASRQASPDLLGQLHQAIRRPIDTVICAVLDADPGLCLNSALAAGRPWELALALALLGKLTGASAQWVVLDWDAPDWLRSPLNEAAKCAGLRLRPIHNVYPQQDPTLLLHHLLRRRLRPGRMPTEQGVLLLDAAAAALIGQAALGRPDETLQRRPAILHDISHRRAAWIMAPRSATLQSVLDGLSRPIHSQVHRIGALLCDERVDATHRIENGENVVHLSPVSHEAFPDACIRCGWCLDACPTRLSPAGVLEAAQQADPALAARLAERAGIEACIECGICNFVCPSRLPLLAAVRHLRQTDTV